ncbi:MAG: hypothetical protein HWN66_09110 [Candidatus Helarchaeota archaeon]|nr:hypothetical protein [Candidatus Helarchaeota archaeon]
MLKTERPTTIPIKTNANVNILLSESNSILFIITPQVVIDFIKCAYISSPEMKKNAQENRIV